MSRRGRGHWAPWAESSPRTPPLLASLPADHSSSDPPLQGPLSKTADRSLLFYSLREELYIKFTSLPALQFLPVLLSSSGPENKRVLWGVPGFSSRVVVGPQPGGEGAPRNHHREGFPFTHSYSSSAEDRLPQPRQGRLHFDFTSQGFSLNSECRYYFNASDPYWQILKYLKASDRLCELGYDEAQVEEALEMFQNCESKVLLFRIKKPISSRIKGIVHHKISVVKHGTRLDLLYNIHQNDKQHYDPEDQCVLDDGVNCPFNAYYFSISGCWVPASSYPV